MRRSRERSGLSEGQARGGGSRPELRMEASFLAGAEVSFIAGRGSKAAAPSLLGRSPADVTWQAGVQQSILP